MTVQNCGHKTWKPVIKNGVVKMVNECINRVAKLKC